MLPKGLADSSLSSSANVALKACVESADVARLSRNRTKRTITTIVLSQQKPRNTTQQKHTALHSHLLVAIEVDEGLHLLHEVDRALHLPLLLAELLQLGIARLTLLRLHLRRQFQLA